MEQVDRSSTSDISAVASLDEPTRRRLYDFVARQPSAVSRDEAAEAVRVPRTNVAFHLDRLVAEGLLEVIHERRTGRTGPGAGRPAKLYRRSAEQIAVSLPDRRYEVVGLLLADALVEAETSGEQPRAVLHRRARDLGRDLGRTARAEHGVADAEGTEDGRLAALRVLESFGFEPRGTEPDHAIVLVNCPFHSLARQHTELVCGMNLCLLDGLLDGLATTGLTAHLAPAPGQCCVRLDPAGPAGP